MKTKTSGTLAAIAIAAAGILVLVFWRAAAVEAVYPVERAAGLFARKAGSRVAGLWRAAEANAENVRLRRELAALAMDRGEYERVLAENARLRAALDFAATKPGRWIVAEVLSSGGGAAASRDTLRVGRGSLAGVAPGAVVEAPGGLVGRVVSVTPHTSEVLLVTDPSLRVSCAVYASPDTKPVFGILSGGSDDTLVLSHLRAEAEVPPHAKVYTSGLGGVFPAGIPVGTFCIGDEAGGDVKSSPPGALEREGKVQPAVDFSTLEDVFIRR